MKIRDFFKPKNSRAEYIRKFLSGDDLSDYNFNENNTYIDQETALKYTAVFACNRVLSETFASMPIMVYRKLINGDREGYTNSRIYDVLHNRPNSEMAPFVFKEMCLTNLNLGGNAVCEIFKNKFDEVAEVVPYRWQDVTISRDKQTNKLIYTIRINNDDKILQRDQVLHVPGLSLNGVMGLTPLEYLAGTINLGLSYQQFGINFYKNGANTSMVFEHPMGLTEGAFNRLKEELKKNIQGLRNTGKPIILEEGMKAKEISIKPADAQLLESKRFQIEDICRVFRVQPHLIQELSRSTNNNIEQQSLEFVMFTMLPHFKRWEENINMQLLSEYERRNGVYTEFNIAGLLRGDSKSRAESYAIGRQWGWLSINDIRRLENMNSIVGGDTYLQPLNMINVTKADEYYSTELKTQKNEILKEIYNNIGKGEII